MNQKIYQNILKKIALTKTEFEHFLTFTKTVVLDKNEHFLNEGKVANYIAFVVSGGLYSYTLDEKGKKNVLQIALENYWISDLYSFFSQEISKLNIEVITKTELIIISKDNFDKCCDTIPAFDRFQRLLFQNAYVNTLQRVAELNSKSAPQRYLDLVNKHPEIIQQVPQLLIASYLGIKPQSLSRIRKKICTKNSKATIN
ncbi:Crp/Fnr family transcriptional regulator [uncultured Tenacibaculum sp.]|uniref:Crp/Fnr family transcriptional regulator n=1 Tax=uncultured Tenacibaculum sp. TaxID=174713 RepID=UPI00262D6516|nr:Crp/Fnr family transcriptional regulator [uncultured Tenacibaculum sp.]